MRIARPLFSAASSCNYVTRSNPARILQCCCYVGSAEPNDGKSRSPFVLHTEKQNSTFLRSGFVPAAFVGAGFAGLAAYIHYNDEKRAVPKGQGDHSQDNTQKGPVIGGPFSLVNTEDQVFTEQNLLDNWVLLYFGYTSSPDIGPEQLQMMAKTIDILETKQKIKILPVFVTLDPERDNPAQLRAYLKEFDSRIVGLTGPVSAIRQMAQEYRVHFKRVEEDAGDYLVETSHNMYLLNPSAKVVRLLGVEYNAEELAEAITSEVKRSTK
ncbi:unnamed protein product [Rhodiola kirilowii]